MKLKMIFKNNKQIEVKLFDKPAVKKWFDHFKKMHRSYYRYDIMLKNNHSRHHCNSNE